MEFILFLENRQDFIIETYKPKFAKLLLNLRRKYSEGDPTEMGEFSPSMVNYEIENGVFGSKWISSLGRNEFDWASQSENFIPHVDEAKLGTVIDGMLMRCFIADPTSQFNHPNINENINQIRWDYSELEKAGKYSQWIINLLLKKDKTLRDEYGYPNYLWWRWFEEDFTNTLKNLRILEHPNVKKETKGLDINKISSFVELFDTASDYEEFAVDESNKTKKTDITILMGSHDGKSPVVDPKTHYFVGIPNTKEAASHLGSRTNWCTAVETASYYDQYSRQGPLYVVVRESYEPQNKYQLHFQSQQYMNYRDVPVSSDEVFQGEGGKKAKLTIFKNYIDESPNTDNTNRMLNVLSWLEIDTSDNKEYKHITEKINKMILESLEDDIHLSELERNYVRNNYPNIVDEDVFDYKKNEDKYDIVDNIYEIAHFSTESYKLWPELVEYLKGYIEYLFEHGSYRPALLSKGRSLTDNLFKSYSADNAPDDPEWFWGLIAKLQPWAYFSGHGFPVYLKQYNLNVGHQRWKEFEDVQKEYITNSENWNQKSPAIFAIVEYLRTMSRFIDNLKEEFSWLEPELQNMSQAIESKPATSYGGKHLKLNMFNAHLRYQTWVVKARDGILEVALENTFKEDNLYELNGELKDYIRMVRKGKWPELYNHLKSACSQAKKEAEESIKGPNWRDRFKACSQLSTFLSTTTSP